jgi:hypothetical protein
VSLSASARLRKSAKFLARALISMFAGMQSILPRLDKKAGDIHANFDMATLNR